MNEAEGFNHKEHTEHKRDLGDVFGEDAVLAFEFLDEAIVAVDVANGLDNEKAAEQSQGGAQDEERQQ